MCIVKLVEAERLLDWNTSLRGGIKYQMETENVVWFDGKAEIFQKAKKAEIFLKKLIQWTV